MPVPQPVVTSNFAGKSAGFYISAALQQATSLEYLTMIENVKFKSNIQSMALGASSIQAASCDFSAGADLTLTEKVLEPVNLQVNMQLCKANLLSSWEALQMRAGAGAPPPASFTDYVIAYIGERIAATVEDDVWNGGLFTGFNAGAGAWLLPATDATVVQDAASAAYTATNIIANLTTAVAAIPAGVLRKEDLFIYMNATTYSFYISAVSELGYVNAYNMNNDYEPVFNGYKIAICPGMTANEIVIAAKSNMFFGTDLLSDTTRVDVLDMGNLDGSDNMRLVARFSAGVQTGVGADIVRQS